VYYNRLDQLLLFLKNEAEGEKGIPLARNGPQLQDFRHVKQKTELTDVKSVLTANSLFSGYVKGLLTAVISAKNVMKMGPTLLEQKTELPPLD